MNIVTKIVLFITASLILTSCANIQPLTGGEKDKKAPFLHSVFPSDSTLNFKYEIEMTFDEYIMLNNFSSKVTINPYIDPRDIKTEIKGKKLYIELPSELHPNTTYHIDFGKSITDIYEKTPFDSLGYTFSTGSFIDTLSIEGKVKLNGGKDPLDDITIGLYQNEDSLNPIDTKPMYYTKSKKGNFTINALPNKKFKIYAFKDVNKNLQYDSLSESIAFLDRLIYTSNKDPIELNLFKERTDKFSFERPTYEQNHIRVKFTRGLKTIETIERYKYIETANTLNIYPKDSNETVSLIAIDSFSNKIDTTITLFKSTASISDSSIDISSIKNYKTEKPFNGIEIRANHLFDSYVTDSITVVLNSDTTTLTDANINHQIIKETNVIRFYTDNKQDTLSIEIPPKSITFVTGHYNKTLKDTHFPFNEKIYGQLTGTIETTKPNYVVYLMKNNKVICSHKNITELDYKYVTPGKYQIKVLIDENNNGVYDTGDLQSKKQPEAYFIYKSPIDIKANWEQGNINITF